MELLFIIYVIIIKNYLILALILAIANRIAAFVTGLEFEDFPEAVVKQVKRSLIDTIGVVLACMYLHLI